MSHAELSPADPQFLVPLSLLDEPLDLMQSLTVTEALPPNYTQLGLGAESGEFYAPPTHLIATVEDLTDMLDYASEDIDGMNDDANAEPSQVPPVTGRWTTTSTYDVYMVDTPDKRNDEDNPSPDEDKPVDKPLKRRCQGRRSWSRWAKDRNTVTSDN